MSDLSDSSSVSGSHPRQSDSSSVSGSHPSLSDPSTDRDVIVRGHPFDPFAFVAGALFLILGVGGLTGLRWHELRPDLWAPALVLVAGLALLATARRPRDADELPEPDGDPV